MTRPADNPFRTERIDRLAYRPIGTSWPELGRRFADHGRRAAAAGGHGTGKSRFLATFAQTLAGAHGPVFWLRCGRDPLPAAGDLAGRLVVADELGALGPVAARRLLARSRESAGILAAVHVPPRSLPVLYRCAPDPTVSPATAATSARFFASSTTSPPGSLEPRRMSPAARHAGRFELGSGPAGGGAHASSGSDHGTSRSRLT